MTIQLKYNISDKDSKFIPSSFFTNKNWLTVIQKSFNFSKKYIYFDYNGKKVVVPSIETKYLNNENLICLPFSFNLNLSEHNEKIIIQNLLQGKNHLLQNREILIKSTFNRFYSKNFDEHFKSKFNYYIVELKKNFQKKYSNNIKRFLKKNHNLIYRFVKNFQSQEFENFFENYLKSSKELRTFFYPKVFFKNLFTECKNNFYIINAYKDDEFIGGHLVLLDSKKKEAIYFCSSKTKVGSSLSVDKFLINHSMKLCFKNNFKIFSLGKVSKKDLGLNNFKMLFGAKKLDLQYFSLMKKNYAILDKRSLIKEIVRTIIRLIPLKIYIIFNNNLFKFLSKY